jgi:hypothetical protein
MLLNYGDKSNSFLKKQQIFIQNSFNQQDHPRKAGGPVGRWKGMEALRRYFLLM